MIRWFAYLCAMEILFEDYYIIAVHKPAGLSTESGHAKHPSMERELMFYITEELNKNSSSSRLKKTPYLRAIHRLDRPSSGVLLFAKTKYALTAVMNQFEAGTVQKSYFAKTPKAPPQESGSLQHFIKKDESGKFAIVSALQTKGAQACSLDYTVLSTSNGETLLDIQPKTGKFHQIRAQLAFIGCPIVGDIQYGARPWRDHEIKLMAYRLSFNHPKSNETMTFIIDPPATW